MPGTERRLPSTNSHYAVDTNEDGCIGISFGPEQSVDVAGSNFIQTVPGRNLMAILRLSGAQLPFHNRTWRPDDLGKVA